MYCIKNSVQRASVKKFWSFTIFQSPTPVTAPILRTWRHYWPFRRSTCDLQSSARLLLSRFLVQSGVGSRELLLGLVTRRTPASPRLKRLMRTDATTLTRWPRKSSGCSCATEAGRRKPRSRRSTTDSRRCRDGTSCRTSASDSQRSSEEAGSPASEEARGCKRRRDLRTQPAVLSRQGRLNEVCCLR